MIVNDIENQRIKHIVFSLREWNPLNLAAFQGLAQIASMEPALEDKTFLANLAHKLRKLADV